MDTLAPIQRQLKYKVLERELRQLVETLPPGARFPAERDLAVKYDCNFLTVRKSLKGLVDDGLITRRAGSGTIVSRPPENAAGPQAEKAASIGVLVFPGGNRYSYSVLQAIAHVALEQNVILRSRWVRDFAEEGLAQAHAFQREGCRALTLPWFPQNMTLEVHDFVRKCPLPVSLPMVIPGLEKYSFEDPGIYGASIPLVTEALCQYFRRLGKRHIAFLGPDSPTDQVLQQKLSAYTLFTSREKLTAICGAVTSGSHSMDQLALRWQTYRGDLAIVSYDDEHALRFMTAMHKLGLSAPQDFTIVGYNNSEASHFSDPPLSTVRQNYEYVGNWLIKSALALADGQISQSRGAPVLDLLVRGTCGGRDSADTEASVDARYLRVQRCDGSGEVLPRA